MSDNQQHLQQILSMLDEDQAAEIKTIDVRGQTTVTDYMIIASGRSSRHVSAIATHLIEKAKAQHIHCLSATGLENGEWVLVDFGDYIVHLFQPDVRAFYNLEGLWDNHQA